MFYQIVEDDNDSIPDLESCDDEEQHMNEEHDDDVQILPESMYEYLTAFSSMNRSVYYTTSESIVLDDIEERMLSEAIVESQNTVQPIAKHVMNLEDFMTLDMYVYEGGKGGGGTMECPITMIEFDKGDTIVILPCKHEFLKESIQRWVTKEYANCPVCRFSLPSREIVDFVDVYN